MTAPQTPTLLGGSTDGTGAEASIKPIPVASDGATVPVSGTLTLGAVAAAAGVAPTVYHSPSTGDAPSKTVATGAKKLYALIAEYTLTTGTPVWVQIHDTAAAPGAAAVPLVSIKLQAGEQRAFDCLAFSYMAFVNGLTVAMSTTGPTYTADATAAHLWFTAFYS